MSVGAIFTVIWILLVLDKKKMGATIRKKATKINQF